MQQYLIHNTSRSRHNRTLRATAPRHGGAKQFVMGSSRRLVVSRPLVVTEEDVLAHLDELKARVKVGLIEIRTPQGALVDLETLTAAALPASAPLPHPVMDSAANDTPAGWDMPQYVGGITQQEIVQLEEALTQEVSASSDTSSVGQTDVSSVVVPGIPPALPPTETRRNRKGK